MITIQPFRSEYINAILDLIERSDSTNRSLETWEGNNMTSVVAFDDNNLIGVLPLERRLFSVGAGRFLNVLWVSGAHVEPEYRSHGVGTAMYRKILDYFYPEHKGIFVYREDEKSPAYNWYKKLGFHELLSILSFKKEIKRTDAAIEYLLLDTKEKILLWEGKLYDCFNRQSGFSGGFAGRHRQFWSKMFSAHYYREFYTYAILALVANDTVLSYTFLGQTSMKDGFRRIDILEFVAPEDSHIKDSLYNAIANFAIQNDLNEVRIQLSVQDPHIEWIRRLGFINRWRFNMMGRLINPVEYFRDCLSEKIDLQRDYQFIIQTPELGEHSIGTGYNSMKLFLNDDKFTEILLCRCSISNAIEEGKVVIVDGSRNNVSVLEDCFPLNKWRYFHIDYI